MIILEYSHIVHPDQAAVNHLPEARQDMVDLPGPIYDLGLLGPVFKEPTPTPEKFALGPSLTSRFLGPQRWPVHSNRPHRPSIRSCLGAFRAQLQQVPRVRNPLRGRDDRFKISTGQ